MFHLIENNFGFLKKRSLNSRQQYTVVYVEKHSVATRKYYSFQRNSLDWNYVPLPQWISFKYQSTSKDVYLSISLFCNKSSLFFFYFVFMLSISFSSEKDNHVSN